MATADSGKTGRTTRRSRSWVGITAQRRSATHGPRDAHRVRLEFALVARASSARLARRRTRCGARTLSSLRRTRRIVGALAATILLTGEKYRPSEGPPHQEN